LIPQVIPGEDRMRVAMRHAFSVTPQNQAIPFRTARLLKLAKASRLRLGRR
jgi:hypothetical protein